MLHTPSTAGPHAPPENAAWRWAYRLLWLVFLLTAALNMLDIRGRFLTNYGADLAVPALLYVTARRYPIQTRKGAPPLVRRLLGATAEIAAISIFVASAATEIAQLYWPRGLFPGTFDPFDIVAYASSVGLCYLADKRSSRPAPSLIDAVSSSDA